MPSQCPREVAPSSRPRPGLPSGQRLDRSLRVYFRIVRLVPFHRPIQAVAAVGLSAWMCLTIGPAFANPGQPGPGTTNAVNARRLLTLTENGVGGLRLGDSLAEIRARRLIGPLRPGCELGTPRPVVARLTGLLVGSAEFTGGPGARRLGAISVTRGAVTDRHVGIGSSATTVQRAYPGARLERSASPLQYSAVVVQRDGRDRIWFLLRKGRVSSIELPAPQFCE